MKWVWELPTPMTRSHTFEAFATLPYSFIVCDILCTKFVAHGDTVLVCKVQYAFGLKWNTRNTWLSPICRYHGNIATLCSMLLAAYATQRTAESQLVCNVHVPWLVAGGYPGIEVVYWRQTIQRKMSNKIKYARSKSINYCSGYLPWICCVTSPNSSEKKFQIYYYFPANAHHIHTQPNYGQVEPSIEHLYLHIAFSKLHFEKSILSLLFLLWRSMNISPLLTFIDSI